MNEINAEYVIKDLTDQIAQLSQAKAFQTAKITQLIEENKDLKNKLEKESN